MFGEPITGQSRPRAQRRRLASGQVPPGRAIAAARAMFDIRAEDVARVAGLTPSLICRLERDQRLSSPEELVRVWDALGRVAFGGAGVETSREPAA